jgi:hypothetical protein
MSETVIGHRGETLLGLRSLALIDDDQVDRDRLARQDRANGTFDAVGPIKGAEDDGDPLPSPAEPGASAAGSARAHAHARSTVWRVGFDRW